MKKVLYIILAFLVCTSVVFAGNVKGSVWMEEDGESPLLIKYTGSTSNEITITSTSIVLKDGATETTVDVSNASYNTIAEAIAGIHAAADADGDCHFKAMRWGGLDDDDLNGNLLAVGVTEYEANTWLSVVKWDTSVALHYDVVFDGKNAPRLGGQNIVKLFGNATGTGNLTVSVYNDGDVIFEKVIVSPVYVLGVASTTNVSDAVSPAQIDIECDLLIDRGVVGFLRIAEVSTATGGGIGATVIR